MAYELERQKILKSISELEAKMQELKDRLQKLDEDRNRGKGNDNDGADKKMKKQKFQLNQGKIISTRFIRYLMK